MDERTTEVRRLELSDAAVLNELREKCCTLLSGFLELLQKTVKWESEFQSSQSYSSHVVYSKGQCRCLTLDLFTLKFLYKPQSGA